MEKELAHHVVVTAIRACSQLGELIPLLRKHCAAREARLYVRAIAGVVGTLGLEIHTRVFAAHPDLEQRVAREMKKYGRVL
jgi:hypothetical protein